MEKLSQSLEDYLETIYTQTQAKGCAKVTDIAKILNVKKASVTGALNNLCEKGLVNYAPYSAVTLTVEGEKTAQKILLRHEVLTKFLQNILQLDAVEAAENACRMEHIMSEEMFKRIRLFSDYIQNYRNKNKEFEADLKKLF